MRFVGSGDSVRFVLVLCALALTTTLPLAVLPPTTAAVTVSASGVLSLAPSTA